MADTSQPTMEAAARQAHRAMRLSIDLESIQTPTNELPITSDAVPTTSIARLEHALTDNTESVIFESESVESSTSATLNGTNTILYLAYGSNLSSQTFKGVRGIRPLSQLNVSAPSLDLVFDLPGLPYREPCFANTAIRKPPKIPPPDIPDPRNPAPPIPNPPSPPDDGDDDDNKPPKWEKGLYGVVYEVTKADYAHILATEGGGQSYKEILVPCIPLPPAASIPEKPPVPELPRPFIARTLFAPQLSLPDDGAFASPPETGWLGRLLRKLAPRQARPNPGYAQPSLRYLGLIRDGAREHDLPGEYQDYLERLQAYLITQTRQKIGFLVMAAIFAPWFLLYFTLSKLLADDKGRIPRWLGLAAGILFNLVWSSYDVIFKPVFGDGERTVEDDDDDGFAAPKAATGRRRGIDKKGCFWDEKTPLLDEASP